MEFCHARILGYTLIAAALGGEALAQDEPIVFRNWTQAELIAEVERWFEPPSNAEATGCRVAKITTFQDSLIYRDIMLYVVVDGSVSVCRALGRFARDRSEAVGIEVSISHARASLPSHGNRGTAIYVPYQYPQYLDGIPRRCGASCDGPSRQTLIHQTNPER
ncbi:MAG: hypothetical protein AAFM91_01770 [Pseudomonadota bacterium]